MSILAASIDMLSMVSSRVAPNTVLLLVVCRALHKSGAQESPMVSKPTEEPMYWIQSTCKLQLAACQVLP